MSQVDVTEQNIREKLSKLNVNKAAGPDQLHPCLLEEFSRIIAIALNILFDRSMDAGKVPSAWKLAKVKPIFKKGDS